MGCRKPNEPSHYFLKPLRYTGDVQLKPADNVYNEQLMSAINEVPEDGEIYVVALCASGDNASSGASRIRAGMFGSDIAAGVDTMPSARYPDGHLILVRKEEVGEAE